MLVLVLVLVLVLSAIPIYRDARRRRGESCSMAKDCDLESNGFVRAFELIQTAFEHEHRLAEHEHRFAEHEHRLLSTSRINGFAKLQCRR